MLVSANHSRHPIIKATPYKERQPIQKVKHHWYDFLGFIFQTIAYVVTDIIINTIFAIIDVVAGVFTSGTADPELIAIEAEADADLGEIEAASLSASFARAAQNSVKVIKNLRKAWQSEKGLRKVGAMSRAFNKARGAKVVTRSILGSVTKGGIKLVSGQGLSGIQFKDGKFGFNREVWSNGSAWLYNTIFVGVSMGRTIRALFGKISITTFQNFLSHSLIDSTDPRLRQVYKQVLNIIAKGQTRITKDDKIFFYGKDKMAFSMRDLLQNYKTYGLTAKEEKIIEEFNELLHKGSNRKGYGRMFFKTYKIYNRLFVDQPSTILGKKLRKLHRSIIILRHRRVKIKQAEFDRAFERWFKSHNKYVGIKQYHLTNREFREYRARQILRFEDKYNVKHFIGKEGGQYSYFINHEQGFLGTFINYLTKTADDVGLVQRIQKKYFVEGLAHSSKFAYPLTKIAYHLIDKEVLWFIDKFESWFLQYITSPFYALERLSVNVVRMIKKSARWRLIIERVYAKKIEKVLGGLINDDVEVKWRFWGHQRDQGDFTAKTKKAIKDFKEHNISFADFNRELRKSYKDYEFFIDGRTPITKFSRFLETTKTKFNAKVDIVKNNFGFETKQRLSNVEYRKVLSKLKNFIAFKFSTILGVQIHYVNPAGISAANDEEEGIDLVKSEGFLAGKRPLTWTIYFAPSTRKSPIVQNRVNRKIAKAFIQCGITNRPYAPWKFYNRYIAWGTRFTSFLKGTNSALFAALPDKLTPIRYYYLDLSSAKDAYQTHAYHKLFTKGISGVQMGKIAAYGTLKNVGGRNLRFAGVSFRALGGSIGSVLVAGVAQRNKFNQATGRVGRRINRLRSYRFYRV